MWVCSNCGTRNDDCSCVCIRCQKKRSADPASAAKAPSQGSAGKTGRRNATLFLSSTFLILVSVAVIVFSVRAVSQGSAEKSAPEPEQTDTQVQTVLPSSAAEPGTAEPSEAPVEEIPSEPPLSPQQPAAPLADGQYFVHLGRDQVLETPEGYSLALDLKEPISFSVSYVQGLQAGDILDLSAFHSAELGDTCPITQIQKISWYREDDYTINPEADDPGLILTLDEDSQKYILMDPHSDHVFYYSAAEAPLPLAEGAVVTDSYTSIMIGAEGDLTGGPEVLFAFFDQWGPGGENVYITVEAGAVTEISIPYSP